MLLKQQNNELSQMITFPLAKINLGLNIVARRPDGYHDLETVFYPIGLTDALEIVTAKTGDATLTCSGRAVDCPVEQNLVMKAFRLMQREYGVPPVDVYLHKIIPDGAGLGGGSSDASHMLLMLNEMFELGLSDNRLAELAVTLGADCPFFIYRKPLMAQGIGDRFSDIDISLSGKALLLLKPNVYVSTKVAYSRVKPKPAQVPLAEALKRPVAEWRHSVVNDFEPGVFAEYPELKTIKDSLYDAGAQFALMSGSGSSIYGIFDSVKMAEEAKKHFNVDSQYVINL